LIFTFSKAKTVEENINRASRANFINTPKVDETNLQNQYQIEAELTYEV
jgi:hypothetical protein